MYIYVWMSTVFYICIYIYHTDIFTLIYTYVSPPIYTYILTYILIYICIISSHCILTASVFSLRSQLACNLRTNVLFNTLKNLDIVNRKFSIFIILKYSI
nr:MAG TPA: hypothetical protein [Caudoviricetes sp.]